MAKKIARRKMLPRPPMKKQKETTADEFVAKHQKLVKDDHSSDSHSGTEMGWLVSYADMMTLLFGLFVLLYVLKSDKTKDADETMRAISNKFFSYQDPISSAIKNEVISPPQLTTEKVEMEKIETEKIELKTQIEKISEEKDKLEEQINDQKIVSKAQQEQIEALNKKITLLTSEKIKKDRQLAKVSEVTTTNISEELKNELEQVKKENAELMEKQIHQQNYVTTLLTWDTEKHDLDLEIIYDKSSVFNFKKRIINGFPGKFEIDSRFGPGIEMWKAENYKPGKYIARIILFNKNGNTHPAKVKLTIFSQSDIFKSEEFQIKNVGIPKSIPFTIDEKGKIQVLQ